MGLTEKTIIYGDSFSSLDYIRTLCDIHRGQMWYAPLVCGELTDRTRAGKSPFTMFLQATHDAITEASPVRMIVALGACHRLPTYTDGWYGEEQLKPVDPNTPLPDPARPTTLSDCEKYLDRASMTKDNLPQFHPTLMWAMIYKGIVDLGLRCAEHGHQLLVLHMNTTPTTPWINKTHHLIAPLCQRAESMQNYIMEVDSCCHICQQSDVRPLDYDSYNWQGHHGPEGQAIFGKHIKKLIAQRQLWN